MNRNKVFRDYIRVRHGHYTKSNSLCSLLKYPNVHGHGAGKFSNYIWVTWTRYNSKKKTLYQSISSTTCGWFPPLKQLTYFSLSWLNCQCKHERLNLPEGSSTKAPLTWMRGAQGHPLYSCSGLLTSTWSKLSRGIGTQDRKYRHQYSAGKNSAQVGEWVVIGKTQQPMW